MEKFYKYKREHFSTQEEFERFKSRTCRAVKKWLFKTESANPEKKERRILRQRLYSRYYIRCSCNQSFREWIKDVYGVEDIRTVSIEILRAIAGKS